MLFLKRITCHIRELRNLVTVKLAIENILSDGVLVLGIFRSDLATLASFGKHLSLFFHQVSGFVVLLTGFSF